MRGIAMLAVLATTISAAEARPAKGDRGREIDESPATTRWADPRWTEADAQWTAAAALPVTRDSVAAWNAAADAYDVVAGDPAAPAAVRRECAYAVLQALRHAARADIHVLAPGERTKADELDWDKIPTPKPLPTTGMEARYLAAAARFLALTDGEHSDWTAGVRFLRANTLRRFDHLDAALADFRVILTAEREHEVGLYAANLLLDSLNRLKRYDEMVYWAWRLRFDRALMARDEEMEERLGFLVDRWFQLAARKAGVAESPDERMRATKLAMKPLTVVADVIALSETRWGRKAK